VLLSALVTSLLGTRASLWPPELLFALAPLPAASDWLTQTVARRESRNVLRIITGVLLGASFGDLIRLLLLGAWANFGLGLAVLATYVAFIGLALRWSGAWRHVLAEHFPGLDPLS
jgi:hypothetical protein